MIPRILDKGAWEKKNQCRLTENASDSAGEACHAEEITEIGLDVVYLDS